MFTYRKITQADNKALAEIIRRNLEYYHLDIPNTVYFDPELDRLSDFYNSELQKRAYYTAFNENGEIIGGVGIAEFNGIESCAELQKLYLASSERGKGYGKKLEQLAEDLARSAGYKRLYLETHTNLSVAINLYEKAGFKPIEKPSSVVHSSMNRFFIKEL